MIIGNYPKDIQDAANEAAARCPIEWTADSDLIRFKLIASAILEERQRCADVATKEGNGYRDNNLPLCAMGAYQVHKAILGGAA